MSAASISHLHAGDERDLPRLVRRAARHGAAATGTARHPAACPADDLEAAYLSHAPGLARYLRRRIGDRHATPDLVHDIFLRVAEHPLASVQDVRAYLYRVAHNLLVDRRKQDARRRTVAVPHEALAQVADDAPSPEDAVDARLRLERLWRIVEELPFKTRQVFVMSRIGGMACAEVARQLEVSLSTVEKHLATALRHVADRSAAR